MAYSYKEYNGDGSTQMYTIPFEYVKKSEVRVYVDGVQLTEGVGTDQFQFSTDSMVTINAAPGTQEIVRIGRVTDLTTRAVDFVAGAVLSEEDLDTANIQIFHGAQEAVDDAAQAVRIDVDGRIDGQNRQVKNVSDPTADDHVVTRGYMGITYPHIENCSQNMTAVTNVHANMAKVTNVDMNMTEVQNVDANIPKVQNIDANMNHIHTINSNMTDVNTVGTNITDVNTVAGHIDDVNSYAATYIISPVEPTGSIPTGTQWYNTANTTKYIYNGNSFEAYNTAIHTVFVGFTVNADGNLIVTTGAGQTDAENYKDWFLALSDATYSVNAEGHLEVHY